jgi:acetyl-CoA C-acetyltransferase
MSRAVIVSTARTPLAKSWKGAFNMTHGATLGGFAVKAAVERAGVDPAAVDDVLMGCANPEGATGGNIARQIALRAGLPITTGGVTVNRFCSSGLQTIAMAAQRIVAGEGEVFVAGGVESISCVQHEMNQHMVDPWLASTSPRSTGACCRRPRRWPSATDPEVAHGRIRRGSQQKACAAQEGGRFKDEIVVSVTAGVADPVLGPAQQEVTDRRRRGAAPGHDGRGHQGIRRRCRAASSRPATPASSATAPAPASSSTRPTPSSTA